MAASPPTKPSHTRWTAVEPAIDYDSASFRSFDEQGQLAPLTDPAATYRFVVELDEVIAGSNGTTSGINLQLALSTTPEPGTMTGLVLLGLTLSRPRRERPR
ncbi:MAG: hypothetical protein AAGL98_02530 [Planctomycetota bacterium]